MITRHSVFKSGYFYLMSLLIGFFIVNPFLEANRISDITICLFFSFIIFFTVYLVADNVYIITTTIILASTSFATYSYTLFDPASKIAFIIHYVITLLFFSIITFTVIVSIMNRKRITADTLLGAICGYLLLGLTWSYLYLLIASVEPNSFSLHMEHDSLREQVHHFIYFSFVTLTTTGYGDIVGTQSVARTFSWMEAASGQIYLTVWIAQLVGLRILQQKNSPDF